MKPTQYDAEIKELQKRIDELSQKRAEELCPFKVGDKIERMNKQHWVAIVQEIQALSRMNFRVLIKRIYRDGKTEPFVSDVNDYEIDEWRKVE